MAAHAGIGDQLNVSDQVQLNSAVSWHKIW